MRERGRGCDYVFRNAAESRGGEATAGEGGGGGGRAGGGGGSGRIQAKIELHRGRQGMWKGEVRDVRIKEGQCVCEVEEKARYMRRR